MKLEQRVERLEQAKLVSEQSGAGIDLSHVPSDQLMPVAELLVEAEHMGPAGQATALARAGKMATQFLPSNAS